MLCMVTLVVFGSSVLFFVLSVEMTFKMANEVHDDVVYELSVS